VVARSEEKRSEAKQMDEVRRIRLLVAPALFVASLLWGSWLDHDSTIWRHVSANHDWSHLIGLIAGGGFVVFVAGYVIGTVTYVILRSFFPCLSKRNHLFHEAALSDTPFQKIWTKLGAPSTEQKRLQELFAVVAFDHGVLRKEHEGVHQWVVRRWTAFNVAANSIFGLALSIPIGKCVLAIHASIQWWVPVLVFVAFLLRSAFWAWTDTMHMLEFMASLDVQPAPRPAARARRRST
jgi:hypothetical protein